MPINNFESPPNWSILRNFSEDASGRLLYKGSPVSFLDGDPFFSQVSLLLNFENENITDLSFYNHSVTSVNAVSSAAQAKFGLRSGYFDGNGDYLEVAGGLFRLEAKTIFTVECWVYRSNTTQHGLLSTRGSASSGWVLRINTNGTVQFFYVGGSSVTSTPVMGQGAWSHIAFVRNGAIATIYVNGVGTSASFSNGVASSEPLRIGVGASDLSAPLAGYLDDVRLSDGIARYTANFTPPQNPFLNR